MAVTSWIRRQFADGVAITATATMTAGATSFTVNTGGGTTFPDGSVGPFIVCVDQGQAAEEKILIQSRTADTFTVATSGRGYNGTTAAAHTAATVLHTIDAQDLDEANQTAHQTLGAVTASGDLLQGSGANTLARLARGTSGQFLRAGASSLSWVSLLASMVANAADLSSVSLQTFTGPVVVNGNLTTGGNLTAPTASITSCGVGSLTGTGTVQAPVVVATLTAIGGRFVGVSNSGPPGTGSGDGTKQYSAGDFVIDYLGATIWICTVQGTPGTWSRLGGQPDAARAYRAAALNSPTSATQITWDTKVYDPSASYSISTGLYTCPLTGLYRVKCQVSAAIPSGESIVAHVWHNGSDDTVTIAWNGSASSNATSAVAENDVNCTAGDTLSGAWHATSSGHGMRGQTEQGFTVSYLGLAA